MFAFAAQLFGRRAGGTNVVAGKENFVATAHTETAAVNCRFKGGECAVRSSRSLARSPLVPIPKMSPVWRLPKF